MPQCVCGCIKDDRCLYVCANNEYHLPPSAAALQLFTISKRELRRPWPIPGPSMVACSSTKSYQNAAKTI
eukprot:6209761-Pleurochrysis_carterae.AAC.1